jgi:hypothetical protein
MAEKDDAAAATAKLNEEQKAELQALYEEERVAYELYHAFGEKWKLRPFLNIQKSELRHREAVKALMKMHGVDEPAGAKPGVFPNKELQAIYDELLASGMKSANDALKAAALVEETDIKDLQTVAATTPSEAVKATCDQLIWASKNHLRAFGRILQLRGVDYQPQVLDRKQFEQIVDNPAQAKGGGQGPWWLRERDEAKGKGGNGRRGRGRARGGCPASGCPTAL